MHEPLSKLSRLGMYLACYTVPLQLTPKLIYTRNFGSIYIYIYISTWY